MKFSFLVKMIRVMDEPSLWLHDALFCLAYSGISRCTEECIGYPESIIRHNLHID